MRGGSLTAPLLDGIFGGFTASRRADARETPSLQDSEEEMVVKGGVEPPTYGL